VCAAESTVDDLAPDSEDDRVADALLSYQKAVEAGRRPDRAEFLRRHADLAEQLEPLLSAGQHADALLSPLQALAPAEDSASRSAARPDGLPSQVDQYRLENEIGRGGMGRIIRILDIDFDRALAMKILLQQGDEQEARFAREARLTGLLQHPGIPPVHALGKLVDGRPYFVMKLIQGRSLKELLKERSSPAADLPRFVDIFGHICHAVGYAHSQGVIHRDLKPQNVMVGAFGEVQVMDWGLAKVLDPPGQEEPMSAESNEPLSSLRRTAEMFEATLAGTVMGTLAYMAPEQARGMPVDARADVFSLGAILCEILTGRPPYVARDRREMLSKARAGDLSSAFPRLASCEIDTELIELARRCLASRPNDRFPDGSAVADEVASYRANLEQRRRQAEIDRAAAEAKAEEEKRAAVAEQALGREEHKRHQEEQRRREAEEAKRKAERRRRWMALALGFILVLLVYVFVVRQYILEPAKLVFQPDLPMPKQRPPTVSNVPSDWQEFKFAVGFSVTMPGKPVDQPWQGPWQFYKVVWKERQMLFLVGSTSLSDNDAANAKTTFDRLRAELPKISGGSLKGEKPVSFSTHEGREYLVETFYEKQNLLYQAVFRYYLVGRRLICLNVGYPGTSTPEEAEKFLNSLKVD
jgi:serine/threonine protein kinase